MNDRYNDNFHNTVANICYKQFNSLPKSCKPKSNEWTVLSCIVQENDAKSYEVVSLGTGTKCIGQNSMSSEGDVLNDSHAEIICRRAFLNYLYDELTGAYENKVSIFNTSLNKMCTLNESIKFHLFTTHVPCGDAAIFPKQNSDNFGNCITQSTYNSVNDCVLNSKRKSKSDVGLVENKVTKVEGAEDVTDIYRTGAKCISDDAKQDLHLDGSEFHVCGAVRTKPGRGDRTLSLSCSDKIVKWTYLGIQVAGNTAYLKSALNRAFFDRFQDRVRLSQPYSCNRMTISQCSEGFQYRRDAEKQPSPCSIVWHKSDTISLEIAVNGRRQGVTKKDVLLKKNLLTITKRILYNKFCGIIERFKLYDWYSSTMTYKDCKLKADVYQNNWTLLKLNLFKVWTVKNENLLNFMQLPLK